MPLLWLEAAQVRLRKGSGSDLRYLLSGGSHGTMTQDLLRGSMRCKLKHSGPSGSWLLAKSLRALETP